MTRVQEIEILLRQLPPRERWEIARWLLDDLQEHSAGAASPTQGESPKPLPDFAARRKRIFGEKVLPNMVLASRAEERW